MTLTKLRSKIRYLLGEVSTDNYSNTNIDRAINDYYSKAVSAALQNSGSWEVQGEVSTANLVADQQEYVLPGDLLNLKRIEADFNNDNEWDTLPVKDMRNIYSPLSDNDTSTTSDYVRVFDNSLFLENPAESNVTNGLKIYYSKEITDLSGTSDDTILPDHCNNYIIHGACLDYCIRTTDTEGINLYRQLLKEDYKNIEKHYSEKLPAVRTKLSVHKENYN